MNLQEKIKYSEKLIDKYLSEFFIIPIFIPTWESNPWSKIEKDAKKKCKSYKGTENKFCRELVKSEFLASMLEQVPHAKQGCKADTNPKKCIGKVDDVEHMVRVEYIQTVRKLELLNKKIKKEKSKSIKSKIKLPQVRLKVKR